MKKIFIIIGVIFLILVLLGGVGVFIYLGVKQGITGDCRLAINGTGEKDMGFYCGEDLCSIYGFGTCSEKNPSSYVTFRTSDLSYRSGWIAIDTNKDTFLEGYDAISPYNTQWYCSRWDSVTGSGPVIKIGDVIDGYYGTYNAYYCQNTAFSKGQMVVVKGSGNTRDVSSYKAGSTKAIVINQPYEGYQNKELYNQYVYGCSVELKKTDGTILETEVYRADVVGNFQTTTHQIQKNEGVSFGKYKIYYEMYQCGACGECEIGKNTCSDSITIQECKSDASGCGIYESRTVKTNYECKDGKEILCDDTKICTTDTRASTETQCKFTQISNCCTSVSECNRGNTCESYKCSSNRCVFTQVLDCCTPSCNTATEDCINQKCVRKQGCKYDNNPNQWCTTNVGTPTTCNTVTNECICPTGNEWCSGNELNQEKCLDNGIYKCEREGACFKWRISESCETGFVCS